MKRDTFLRILAVHAWLVLVALMTGGLSVHGTPTRLPRRGQPAQAQEPAKNTGRHTVWDGVYTDAQAVRGQTQYEASCRACHAGGPRSGEAFMREWSGTEVESLFSWIKAFMPPGAPSSLSDAAYLDVVAYMLRGNAFPTGRNELSTDAIRNIRIEGRNGPEPVQDFVLVRVVGCLAQGSGAAWALADAGEPVRTKDPAPSKDEELKNSEAAALGTQTFQLLNVYPTPAPYTGHKVEAKGFLIRDPSGNRLNVTSVHSLAPRCD